jgi:release factor-specific protein-(glutamine-N5) methyltransferase
LDYKKIFIKGAAPTSIGGQAVMEGVMMRSTDRVALSMRLPDDSIYLKTKKLKPPSKARKIPLIRGVVSFFASLVDGMKILMDSADVLERTLPDDEEPEEPGRFEKWVNTHFGERAAWNIMLTISLIIAIVVTIAVFVIFPTAAVNWLKQWIPNAVALNLIEGVFRIVLFILYIAAISHMKDIDTVFRYHGAEHKTIHCYENGLELTPENAQQFYTLHPRCGTSFIMFVLIVSLLLFSLLGWPSLALRIASRLLLLPVIAGISFELLRWAGRSDNAFVRVMSWPGLMLQKLTTREPSDHQLEVAIVSMKAVLVPADTPAVEGIVDKDANIIEEKKILGDEEDRSSKAEGAGGGAEKKEPFPDLKATRYGDDLSMVRNIVRDGKKKLEEAGIPNGRREAEDIFCYVMGFTHNEIITRDQEVISEADRDEYEKRIAMRLKGVPLQYITRVQEFMGLPFRVNENVLIPRLDTEVLADQALGLIEGRDWKEPDVLDMCTGSGILGITIAHEVPGAKVTLSDVSVEALAVAKSNSEINGVADRCTITAGNMFEALPDDAVYDMIICNPPYIRTEDIETLDREVRIFEPRLALDGGADGLTLYRIIARDAAFHLREDGVLALEIGYDQAQQVSFLLERTGEYGRPAVIKDLQGRDRVIMVGKKAGSGDGPVSAGEAAQDEAEEAAQDKAEETAQDEAEKTARDEAE